MEHEVVVSMERMLRHEADILRQLNVLMTYLQKQRMDISHQEEFYARRKTTKRQGHEVQKLKDSFMFHQQRLEALREAMMFYLAEHYAIDVSEPCTLDLENERLLVGPVATNET